MQCSDFCIGFATDVLRPKAEALARQYGVQCDSTALPRLHYTEDSLVLMSNNFLPIKVDFERHFMKPGEQKRGLMKACKPVRGLRILDATAGWGRDAALLASAGADVLMLERQPMMAALLADGLARLSQRELGYSLALRHVDALIYLKQLSKNAYPDIIYIDPMHPLRQKSALVKKDMQIMQQLFGPDSDAAALITEACLRVCRRVVVKWPQHTPPLLKPTRTIAGKTVRFDCYDK